SDWNDTGECHNYDKTYPSGRIYRVEYVKDKMSPQPEFDIAKMLDGELAGHLFDKNEWFVRRARLQLTERAWAGKLDPGIRARLRGTLATDSYSSHRLRALWALHGMDG